MSEVLSSGVYMAFRKDGTKYYRSSITYKNKHISLGSFDTDKAAHLAYTQATDLLSSELMVDDYSHQKYTLPFEKWVVLCNFRDNGLYISNPIYIRSTFFYYYFSKDDFFLFSIEDLFYYSAHKIQRRGGHYFVADYGSQLNIFNRYGIMSYAVEGRDYTFINGHSKDMQYSNIRIINSYHGVIPSFDGASPVYKVRINVNGYYNVGTYSSAVEAAIAYNKAADTLKEAGIAKQYATNYIDGLSAKAYADLYTSIVISEKITSMNNR